MRGATLDENAAIRLRTVGSIIFPAIEPWGGIVMAEGEMKSVDG
jgi:hypothetical protein